MYNVKLTVSPYDSGAFRQIPRGGCVWGNYRFFENEDIDEADFWVSTFRAFRNRKESCRVAPENTVFLVQEPDTIYRYSRGFLNQFGLVISCQETLKHRNVVNDIPANLWWNGKIIKNKSSIRYSRSYDDFCASVPEKTKLISVISSDKVFTEGHRDRLSFVKKLKAHYGDALDFFGYGTQSFVDKWDVLSPYRYHICIENISQPYYWSEKLADTFLSNTFPFYYGCTNLEDYFPEDSFCRIDIHDVEGAIRIIDSAMDKDLASKNADAVQKAKMKVLNEYNLFPFLVKYLEKMNPDAGKEVITLRNDLTFPDVKKVQIVAGRKLSQLKYKLPWND